MVVPNYWNCLSESLYVCRGMIIGVPGRYFSFEFISSDSNFQ